MQKRHSFLLSARNKTWFFATMYAVLFLVLIFSSQTMEKKTTAVVYAKAETTEMQTDQNPLSVSEAAETKESEQIQLTSETSEQEELIEESAQVMQQELANQIASQVTKAEQKKKAQEEKKIHLSKTDTKILERIVEAEATGEDIEGKMLVANVILNRVNCEEFPDSVEKVVFSKKQFSPIRDGRYYSVSITDETKEAVKRVLNGEDKSNGALYFMSRKKANAKNVAWFDAHLTKVAEYGTHEFFK